jgi:hypothetical protein
MMFAPGGFTWLLLLAFLVLVSRGLRRAAEIRRQAMQKQSVQPAVPRPPQPQLDSPPARPAAAERPAATVASPRSFETMEYRESHPAQTPAARSAAPKPRAPVVSEPGSVIPRLSASPVVQAVVAQVILERRQSPWLNRPPRGQRRQIDR